MPPRNCLDYRRSDSGHLSREDGGNSAILALANLTPMAGYAWLIEAQQESKRSAGVFLVEIRSVIVYSSAVRESGLSLLDVHIISHEPSEERLNSVCLG